MTRRARQGMSGQGRPGWASLGTADKQGRLVSTGRPLVGYGGGDVVVTPRLGILSQLDEQISVTRAREGVVHMAKLMEVIYLTHMRGQRSMTRCVAASKSPSGPA